MDCECEKDGECPRYKMPMHGRMREICRGINVGVGDAEMYRQHWLNEALQKDGKPMIAIPAEPSIKCPHLGLAIKDASGENVKRVCGPCGGKERQVFACGHGALAPQEVTVEDCSRCEYRPQARADAKPIILKNHLSPGDVLVMTAAIRSLHISHPGKFIVGVDTTADAVFEHSPDVMPLYKVKELGGEEIQMHYPKINRSNQEAIHFLGAYHEFLSSVLKVNIPVMTNRPHVWLSRQEKSWQNQVQDITGKNKKFWIVNAGVKNDFTAKQWPWYQEVIDRMQGKILFVQVGKSEHIHQPLRGTLNLIDKTDNRQLIRLAYHSQGVLCGTTFLMHLAAALEKPAVILAGAREPRQWNQYPLQSFLSTVGSLPCCAKEACWRSRVIPLNDGAEQDKSLCDNPTYTDPPSPKCLAIISADQACGAIQNYLN